MHTLLGLLACLLPVLLGMRLAATEVTVLSDFESDAELGLWDYSNGAAALSAEHASHGRSCLRIASGASMSSYRLPRDWSAGDELDMDFFVEGTQPVEVTLMIGDAAWEQKRTYWNRHNGGFTLRPGANTIALAVHGLYRGEAGSRANDLQTSIDPHAITLIALSFACPAPAAIYADYFRLVRERPPEGIIALHFGPEDQASVPGFTALSPSTVHGVDGHRAGWTRPGMASRGRDDTFPTRLLQSYIEPALDDMELAIDVPDGPTHVWFVYSDCGYWGGEEAKARRRSIDADGTEVFVDDRGEEGPCDYLFRFEHLEPRPGASVWDLYMKDLFQPHVFTAKAAGGTLHLHFHSDAPWSSKIAAMIVYPESIRQRAEAWIAALEQRNRQEFAQRAIELAPVAPALQIPEQARSRGWWLGYPSLEAALAFSDAPGPAEGRLARTCAKGQRASVTWAIRPLRSFGAVTVSCSGLTGPGGTIPAEDIECRYLHQGLQRTGDDLAYRIVPVSVRRVAGSRLTLEQGLTRQFWTTVAIPADARPGTYSGEIEISAGVGSGALAERLPLTVEVLDLTLSEPPIPIGFFGLGVPDGLPAGRSAGALRELMLLLRSSGMTSFSGGPGIPFSGLDPEGRPQLDFSACDAFFRLARACGYTQDVFSYGGPGMVEGLQDGYTIGATGHGWEAKTGRPFAELLRLVWGAVEDHARSAGWPRIDYGLSDEPRTVESARAQLELQQAYHDNVPALPIGGFYSLDWGGSDIDRILQTSFRTLTWSALNSLKPVDIDQARAAGRELCMYNQGTSRSTFGRYCWARLEQGIKGFMQWHTSCISGYQFFDLDGREPDFAMVQWGRSELIPTLPLLRCAEGLADLRYAVTLEQRARMLPEDADARAALAWLASMAEVPPGQRAGHAAGDGEAAEAGEAFRDGCIERLRILLAKR